MNTTLAPGAQRAMHAFEAMQKTKQAHFALLEKLEDKRIQGGKISVVENLALQQLLETHSTQVESFRSTVADLRSADLVAYQSLIDHLSFASSGKT